MKHILFLFFILIICQFTNAQNGTYVCNYQRFDNLDAPSKNAEHFNEVVITISINSYGKGMILMDWPNEDNMTYRYDVYNKIDSNYDRESKAMVTAYKSKFAPMNIPTNKEFTIVIYEKIEGGTLDIATTLDGSGINWYHNLKKKY
jgi:hypothetical protein